MRVGIGFAMAFGLFLTLSIGAALGSNWGAAVGFSVAALGMATAAAALMWP